MNDVALAETLVIAMRRAAMREMKLNNEPEKPTLQTILEFGGEKMAPAPESTPHANTKIYSSTYEGAQPIVELSGDSFVDAAARKSYAKLEWKFHFVRRVGTSYHRVRGPRLMRSQTRTQPLLYEEEEA